MSNNFHINGLLAERIFNTPLLLEQRKAEAIAHYLEQRINGEIVDGEISNGEKEDRKRVDFQQTEDVAVIPIIGSLVHRGSFMDAASGIMSYGSIRQSIMAAAEDRSVRKILLDIDSGGGEVEGNFDLAKVIRQINDEVKPVVAIANGSAYSGAYSLGVAAGDFFVTETGGVGSVGVIIQHVDFSKANDKVGIKVTNIVAGDRKDELSSDFPLSEEARQFLQDRVDFLGNIFINHVADMREISPEVVISTQAGLTFAEEAVRIGFVDGITSFDNLLEELIEADFPTGVIKPKTEVTGMFKKRNDEKMNSTSDVNESESPEVEAAEGKEDDKPEAPAAEDAEGKEDDKPEAPAAEEKPAEEAASIDPVKRASAIAKICAKSGYADETSDFIESDMTITEVKEKIDGRNHIKQACILAGKKSRADGFIKDGTPLSEVNKILIEEASDDEAEIHPTYSPEFMDESFGELKEGAQSNLLVENAKKRREKSSK